MDEIIHLTHDEIIHLTHDEIILLYIILRYATYNIIIYNIIIRTRGGAATAMSESKKNWRRIEMKRKVTEPKCKFKLANYSVLKEMCENPKLRGNCYTVYVAILMFHNDDTNECFPSLKDIANIVGIADRNVSAAITKLVDEGFLIVNSGKQGTCNNYYFPKEVYFGKNGEEDEPYEVPLLYHKRKTTLKGTTTTKKKEEAEENSDGIPF